VVAGVDAGVFCGKGLDEDRFFGEDRKLKTRGSEWSRCAMVNHGQAGNSIEVPEISGDDAVAKFERRDADEEVGKCDGETKLCKVSVQATCMTSQVSGHGIYVQYRHHIGQKEIANGGPSLAFCTRFSMSHFHNGDDTDGEPIERRNEFRFQ